jgi:hypothetical protein
VLDDERDGAPAAGSGPAVAGRSAADSAVVATPATGVFGEAGTPANGPLDASAGAAPADCALPRLVVTPAAAGASPGNVSA